MPLHIVQNDITTMKVDAIVNAANQSLLGGGGVDGAIHRAAGPQLLAECRTLGGCKTGEAKITRGYRLPAQYVIHTVGPIWRGGRRGERELLESAYRSSLELALANGCQTVAFPLISSGVYGYPKEQALKVAVDTIGSFVLDHDMTVYLVIFDRAAFPIAGQLFGDLTAYLAGHWAGERTGGPEDRSAPAAEDPAEPFSQLLLRSMDERGMDVTRCARRANLDREYFSRLCSDFQYRPPKPVVTALAVALELPLEELRELLGRAGFPFSHSSRFDTIVEYFVTRRDHDVFAINTALFFFDQPLLGG